MALDIFIQSISRDCHLITNHEHQQPFNTAFISLLIVQFLYFNKFAFLSLFSMWKIAAQKPDY